MASTSKKQIVVIGGGMAGTAAAHWLLQRDYEVTVIEKNDRLGGRMRSEIVDGTSVEMGAGFITKLYTNVQAFLADNDLERKLYRQHAGSGIVRDGKVQMAALRTLAGSGVLSWGAKVQALAFSFKALSRWRHLDMHAFWRAEQYDTQSVSQMVSRRAGKEFLEYVLQPILNGYFYWTPERTSKAMMLILGKAALQRGATLKLRGGLQQIPEKAAEGCRILLSHTVKRVEQKPDGSQQITMEYNGRVQTIRADGVVCATTASAVPKIIASLNDQQRTFFSSINYSSTVLVAHTYRKEQLVGDKSIAFPRKEKSALAAVTASAESAGGELAFGTVKAYASGSVGKELCGKSDEEIIRTLAGALEPVREQVLRENAAPVTTYIQRWLEAIPMFEAGHFKKLKLFASGEVEDPERALVFAGDYIGGPFIEGAFTSGVQAAERLDGRLKNGACIPRQPGAQSPREHK